MGAQQLTFAKPILQSQAATEVFFCIVNILVRNKKPLQVGEIVKQTFLDAGNALLNELKNKDEIMQITKGIPLSRQSVTRQVEGRGELKKCTSKTVIFPYSSVNQLM